MTNRQIYEQLNFHEGDPRRCMGCGKPLQILRTTMARTFDDEDRHFWLHCGSKRCNPMGTNDTKMPTPPIIPPPENSGNGIARE